MLILALPFLVAARITLSPKRTTTRQLGYLASVTFIVVLGAGFVISEWILRGPPDLTSPDYRAAEQYIESQPDFVRVNITHSRGRFKSDADEIVLAGTAPSRKAINRLDRAMERLVSTDTVRNEVQVKYFSQ